MPYYPSLNRLAELQQLIADFAKIKRAVPLANANDAENDVEHSYGLAMTCWFLYDKIAPDLDLSKILRYALSHDIVEVHAGDTYIFDTAAVATKYQREKDATRQLEDEWRDFPELISFTEGYADKVSNEARFVYAIDKLLPVIMVELSSPRAIWERKGVSLDMLQESKQSILQSEAAAPYHELLIDWLKERDNIPKN